MSKAKRAKVKEMTRAYARTLRMILGTILMCLLIFSASTIMSDASGNDYIKVGLRYGSSTATATVTSDGGFAVGSASDSGIYGISSLSGGNSLTLALSGGKVYVKDASGNVLRTLTGNGTECILGGNYASDNSDCIGFNGKSYRGAIIPYINSSGQMNIINFLSLDDYTRGVIHNEIGQSSALEAIKVQAVATRSFAYTISGKHSSQGFDICTTTHCQVYNGAGTEYASTNKAVDETLGEMIWYEGKPVQAYYAANSGGYTENSEDTWSAALGYARSKPDPYSPDKIWTATITRAQLTQKFASKGIGTVKSITINKVNPSGYVASVTVNGSVSSVTISKESIRSGLGVSLKSRNFIFETTGGVIVGSIKRAVSGTGSQPSSKASLAGIEESDIYDATSSQMLIDGYADQNVYADSTGDSGGPGASDSSGASGASNASSVSNPSGTPNDSDASSDSEDEAVLASEIPTSYVQNAQGKSLISSVITALSFTGKVEKSTNDIYAINCNGKVSKLCAASSDNGSTNNGSTNNNSNTDNNGSTNNNGSTDNKGISTDDDTDNNGISTDDGDSGNNGSGSKDNSGGNNTQNDTDDEIPVVTGSSTASGSMTVVFNSDSDVLIISGRGYGHGVGLSQQGAQQMAKMGFNYRQILKFYYTGIEVK